MKNKLSLFCACFVFTLTFFPSFIRAETGIKIIQQEITAIEKQLSENNLKGMHQHAEAIVDASKKLDQDSTLDETKKKRVQGYTKNLAKLADKRVGDLIRPLPPVPLIARIRPVESDVKLRNGEPI